MEDFEIHSEAELFATIELLIELVSKSGSDFETVLPELDEDNFETGKAWRVRVTQEDDLDD